MEELQDGTGQGERAGGDWRPRTHAPNTDASDRFPQAMIEGSTEYDWSELPDWLKNVMRRAADEFRGWADVEPIKGEVIPEPDESFAGRMARQSIEAMSAKYPEALNG